MKRKIVVSIAAFVFAVSLTACGGAGETKETTVTETPVEASEAGEEDVAKNATVNDLTAETMIENEEAEDEAKELPIQEVLKNTDITDLLSLYYSAWDAYIVLSNDYNNLLCYNLWSSGFDASVDEAVIDLFALEEYRGLEMCSETDPLSDKLLGVTSNYYCIPTFSTALSWNNLSYGSSCTIEECMQLFSRSNYFDIETEDIETTLTSNQRHTDHAVSGKIYSNNILWTVRVILSNDAVRNILFIPEGGIKNAPLERGIRDAPIEKTDLYGHYSFYFLISLKYGQHGDYITSVLNEYTLLQQDAPEFDFSNDRVTCSDTFTMFANSDLTFKKCYVGKDKCIVGYAQDSDDLICGYDILDDGVTLCGLRIGEKAENDHVIYVAGLGQYYTVRKSEDLTSYIIKYERGHEWYICISLDHDNIIKGMSFLRDDVCILDN